MPHTYAQTGPSGCRVGDLYRTYQADNVMHANLADNPENGSSGGFMSDWRHGGEGSPASMLSVRHSAHVSRWTHKNLLKLVGAG